MKIVTRLEAAKAGLNRFYTGKKCKHGHDSERWVHNGACVKCNYEAVYRRREQLVELMHSAREAT